MNDSQRSDLAAHLKAADMLEMANAEVEYLAEAMADPTQENSQARLRHTLPNFLASHPDIAAVLRALLSAESTRLAREMAELPPHPWVPPTDSTPTA